MKAIVYQLRGEFEEGPAMKEIPLDGVMSISQQSWNMPMRDVTITHNGGTLNYPRVTRIEVWP